MPPDGTKVHDVSLFKIKIHSYVLKSNVSSVYVLTDPPYTYKKQKSFSL